MNDKQLKSLIKTVECGSFTKAEDVLFLSRQALKKQIDSLEEELGFTLLIRTHQGIALTPAGEEFCRCAKAVLGEVEATVERCKELAFSEQVIRIAVPHHPRLLLENAFSEFYRRFPNIKQQVILQPYSRSIDGLLEGRIDIAEYIYRPTIESTGLQYIKLCELPFKCLMAPSHPLANKTTIHCSDLYDTHVYFHNGDDSLLQDLNQQCPGLVLDSIENDMQKITNICYNGGVFISKAYFVDTMKPLLPIKLETDVVPEVVLLYRKSPSPNVRKFLNMIKEMYPQDDVHAKAVL